MKKFILAALCIQLLFTLSATAQNGVIVRAGASLSKPKVDPKIGEQSSRKGFFIGLGFESPISDLVSLQPELMFIQKGDHREGLGITGESLLNYLELPILFKVNLPVKPVKVYFNAGPSVSYAISGEGKGSGYGLSGSEDIKFGDKEGETKPLDIGVQAGGGIGYKLGKNSTVLLDVRYGAGLSNLNNFNNQEYKNRTWTIGLGFAF